MAAAYPLVSPVSNSSEVDLVTRRCVRCYASSHLARVPIKSEAPRIARTAVLGRPDDAASLIDPHGTGNIGHSVEPSHDVARIDQARVIRLRRPYPFSDYWRATGVKRHCNQDDTAPEQVIVEFLPDRQVLAAASPRCPGKEQHLGAAEVAQSMLDTVEVWESEIWRRAADGGSRWSGGI